MILEIPFPDKATAQNFLARIETEFVPEAVQILESSLSVDGVGASTFVNYFTSGLIDVSLESRLKRLAVPVLPTSLFSASALHSVAYSATEYIDGTDNGSIGPTSGVLLAADIELILLSGAKYYVKSTSRFPFYYQNKTDFPQDVDFEITVFTRLGSTVYTDSYTVAANSLMCYFFPVASYFVENCYKIRVSASIGIESLGTIDLYLQKSVFFGKDFYFVNSYNVWEAWCAVGGKTEKISRELAAFEYENSFGQQVRRTWREFEFTSQPAPQSETSYYSALFSSKNVFIFENGTFKEIFITANSIELIDTDSETSRLKFTYRYAEIQN